MSPGGWATTRICVLHGCNPKAATIRRWSLTYTDLIWFCDPSVNAGRFIISYRQRNVANSRSTLHVGVKSQCKGRTHVTDVWTPPDQMSACGVSAAVLFTSPRCGHFLSGTETQPRIVMLLCVLSPPCLPSVCSPLLRYQTLVLRWWASLQPSLSYSCSNFFLLTMSCLSFDHLLVTSRYCQVCRNTAATLPVPTADRFDLLTRDNNLHIYCQRT